MKTLILGMGNPYFSNDSIGLTVASEVFKKIKDRKGVFLKKTMLSGLNLLGIISGYDKVIIIDSMIVEDRDVGRCFKIEIKDCSNHSYHQMGVLGVLSLAKRLNLELPKDLEIYGIGIPSAGDVSKNFRNRIPDLAGEICMDLVL